jgi:hypothetical protein
MKPSLLRIDSAPTSVLDEQCRLGTPWFDFATEYPLALVDSSYLAVSATKAILYQQEPLLYFSPDRSQAVVSDRAFLTTLSVVDATNLQEGDKKVLGCIRPEVLAAIGPHAIVRFLVLADALRIYAHLEGFVCLYHEQTESDGTWEGHFEGEHTYMTSGHHTQRMHFSVCIEASGRIFATGLGRY